MGDVGDGERKNEDDKKGKRRWEGMDELAAHGGEQPFQGGNNTQCGAGGNNPQVQGPISAVTEGNVNLGLQVSGGSNVNLGTQGGSNPQVKGFISADGNINFGKQVFGGGNVNLGTQYYDGTRPSPETELFGDGKINLGNQLYLGDFNWGPYGFNRGTITELNGVTVIRPYGNSE